MLDLPQQRANQRCFQKVKEYCLIARSGGFVLLPTSRVAREDEQRQPWQRVEVPTTDSVVRYRQKQERIVLTASTGQPFTSAPNATAHQKVHADGSVGCWLPSNALPSPLVTAPNWPRSQGAFAESEGCRTDGLAITLIIASRMWLVVEKEAPPHTHTTRTHARTRTHRYRKVRFLDW